MSGEASGFEGMSDVPEGIKKRYSLRRTCKRMAISSDEDDDHVFDTPTKIKTTPSNAKAVHRAKRQKTNVEQAKDELDVLGRENANIVTIIEPFARQHGANDMDADLLRYVPYSRVLSAL